MEFIEVKGVPEKAIKAAYDKGNYIEAIQILHAWLENQAQMLIMMIGSVHFDSVTERTWDTADTFSFNQCLRILFILNQISESEYKEFIEFDYIRDEVVNKIYLNNFNGDRKKIEQKQFEKVFKVGLENFNFFTSKSEIVGDKRM